MRHTVKFLVMCRRLNSTIFRHFKQNCPVVLKENVAQGNDNFSKKEITKEAGEYVEKYHLVSIQCRSRIHWCKFNVGNIRSAT